MSGAKKKGLPLPIGLDILEALAKLQEVELEDVEIDFEELELSLSPGPFMVQAPRAIVELPEKAKLTSLLEAEFQLPVEDYPGVIVEVELGATRAEGGSRARKLIIGGERAPAYYSFLQETPHRPVIALDVFDYPEVRLPRAVKMHIAEVLHDPAEWARLSVERFGAEMVNIHLVSIDPLIKNTPPKEAVKTVEEVLQAVDVPIAVGGCGDPKKDLEVFKAVAEATEGERILFGSVTLDMDIEATARVVEEHGHRVIAFTSMDVNKARELNRKLYEYMPKEHIVMDTTTGALGYGLDYAFTVMERARLAALKGDPELNHPICSGATNAWAAREAWMQLGPQWAPRELRGPIWEAITAETLLLAGVDYFMMMHPASMKAIKMMIDNLMKKSRPEKPIEWAGLRI